MVLPYLLAISRHASPPWRLFVLLEMRSAIRSPLFEIPFVLVRLNHLTHCVVNADHSIM
jgi:hypothetical protein